ncbi:MAG TPA: tyrosine-protein phosphatase, partial [Ramlibacter sp.]
MCRLREVAVHSLPIEPTIVQKLSELMAAGHRLTGADVTAHMQDTYRGFVRHNTPRFAEFFTHLLESNEPTVFHCTAGKDRTGFAAALLLKAVGASDEEVMRDYLLTNERLQLPDVSRLGLPREAMEVLWRVQPAFLHAALEEVDASYGSLEGYFREGLGLREREREHLRHHYG